MKLWEIVRYEIWYQFHRWSTLLYFLVMVLLVFLNTRIFEQNAQGGEYFLNAPLVLTGITAVSSLCGLLLIAAFASDAATRDAASLLEPLVYTSPVSKRQYLGGRFLGAFIVSASLMLAALPTGYCIVLVFPGVYPDLLGAASFLDYLRPILMLALPSTFFFTALLFSLAVLTRKAMASYAGGVFLFLLSMGANSIIAKYLNRWTLGKLIDASGLTVLSEMKMSWSKTQINNLEIGWTSWFVYNRLAWLSLGLLILVFTYIRFQFKHQASGHGRRTKKLTQDQGLVREWSTVLTAPFVTRSFTKATHWRQLSFLALASCRALVFSKEWLLVPMIGVFLFLVGPELMEGQLGVPLLPTTGRMIMLLQYPLFGIIVAALTIISAGYLVWNERETRLADITDVTPVPDWVLFLSKFLGLCLMLLAVQVVVLVACLVFQWYLGYTAFQLGLYLQVLFGLQFLEYLLFAILALAAHVLINQKYVAHLFAFLLFLFTIDARELGIENNMLIFSAAPAWEYSDMNGFGGSIKPWLWFKGYWFAWSFLLLFGIKLFWIRGREVGVIGRLRQAKARVGRPQLFLAIAAMLGVFTFGSFVFYNTNVLNTYSTSEERGELRAEYERQYGRFRNVRQPILVHTSLQVEIYPEESRLGVTGNYWLVNQHAVPLDTIILTLHPETNLENLGFNKPAKAILTDQELGHRVYALATPLVPGDSVQLNFALEVASAGFTNNGHQSLVSNNGTRLDHMGGNSYADGQWLPTVGYQTSREYDDPGDRKRYSLAPRAAVPSLYSKEAIKMGQGRERIAFEAIIGTSKDQTAVAPGQLIKSWATNNRNYFHYVANVPITNLYGIFSAKYTKHSSQWKGVDIEVFHHPNHTRNVAQMVHSVKASLDYFSQNYSPYQYRQIKMVQDPGSGTSLRAYPGTITFSEGYAQLAPETDKRDLDLPFAVMSHEVAHQWWGHQIMPAQVEGAPLLSESLAWYSAMNVVEKTYGPEHLNRLLNMMRQQYLTPKEVATTPLIKATDHFEGYRLGPFAMYALREYVGAPQVDKALRQFLQKHSQNTKELPTSLDLLQELESVTPDSLQYLLTDLLRKPTRWKLKTWSAYVLPMRKGNWEVVLEVEAKKLIPDKAGKQQQVPMQDLVEIGVYAGPDEGGEKGPLYLKKHRLKAGRQTIQLVVNKKPTLAGIDPRYLLLDPEMEDNLKEVVYKKKD